MLKCSKEETLEVTKNKVIDAPPEVVFNYLITHQNQLTNWFPDQAILETNVGGKMKFSFYKNSVTERDLAYHMTIEHTLFFVIGVMSVQVAETILKLSNRYKNDHLRLGIVIPLWARLLRKLFTINKYGYVWIIIAIGLLTF
jgi:hypothetical protein